MNVSSTTETERRKRREKGENEELEVEEEEKRKPCKNYNKHLGEVHFSVLCASMTQLYTFFH